MDLAAFLRLRPFAFHTTAARNLPRLIETRSVESTRTLFMRMGASGDPRLRQRRGKSVYLDIGGHSVAVRDQRPIAAGSIDFEPGWDLGRWVERLNGFAFFWPGTPRGPIDYGRNHFERYRADGEDLVVLRVRTDALVDVNAERPPFFSRCNSGSARMQNGKRLPRGAATFLSAGLFEGPPGDVKELVFEGHAVLPGATEWGRALEGPWMPLGDGGELSPERSPMFLAKAKAIP